MLSVVWLFTVSIIAKNAASVLPPLPVNPGGIGGLFRGPNSETLIKGPDGSVITSAQIGGEIQTEEKIQPIVVEDVHPIETPIVSPVVQPALIQTPVVQETPVVVSQEEPHIIETELVDAPEIEPEQNSDLKGPSGSISVRGSSSIISGPASTTISEPKPKILAAPSVILSAPAVSNVPIAVAPPQQIIPPTIPLESTLSPLVSSTPISLSPLTGDIDTSKINLGPNVINTQTIGPLPQNVVPLNTVVSTTSGPVLTDVDVSRINLGHNVISNGQNIDARNLIPLNAVVSSTPAPVLSNVDVSRINLGSSINAVSTNVDVSRINLGQISAPSNVLTAPVSSNVGNVVSSTLSPDLAIPQGISQAQIASISNQIGVRQYLDSRIPDAGVVNEVAGPSLSAAPQPVGHTLAVPAVLDSLIVQPSDPNNREYLDVGGTRLESVGKIVPVVRNPVVVQNTVPLALSDDARYDLNVRYGRQTKNAK